MLGRRGEKRGKRSKKIIHSTDSSTEQRKTLFDMQVVKFRINFLTVTCVVVLLVSKITLAEVNLRTSFLPLFRQSPGQLLARLRTFPTVKQRTSILVSRMLNLQSETWGSQTQNRLNHGQGLNEPQSSEPRVCRVYCLSLMHLQVMYVYVWWAPSKKICLLRSNKLRNANLMKICSMLFAFSFRTTRWLYFSFSWSDDEFEVELDFPLFM